MATDTSWIPPALEPVALRLARADQAALDLGRLSFEWSRNEPLELCQVDVSNDPGVRNLVVADVRPIPPAVSMLFSEAINHLRAAIDNVLFHLVEQSRGSLTDQQARKIAMPILDEPDAFDKWLRGNAKAGLSALSAGSELATRIRTLQPFADPSSVPSLSEDIASLWRVEPERVHPLKLIQGYSNADKHRALRVAAARTYLQRSDQPRPSGPRGMRPVQRGDVLASVPKDKRVELDSHAAVHIERPHGTAWVPPGRELDNLYAHVAGTVIPTLALGLAIPRAFPPGVDLSDTGQTDRERIDAGTWETAHQRTAAASRQAWFEAVSAPPTVPPIVEPGSIPPSGKER